MKLIFLVLLIHFASAPGISQVSSTSAEVTFEQFGCKGNGTDETGLMLKALEYARKQQLPVRLLGKTYIFSPSSTVNITGIPAIKGTGTLDLSHTGKAAGNDRMTAVFHVEGTKNLVQRNARSIKSGSNSLLLDKALSLKTNDILFVASAEPLENSKRNYYCKGQRVIVKQYDPVSGELTISAPFYYTIGSACIWKLTYQPAITVEKPIRFLTAPMNFISCFRLYYAKGNISGYYKNFALTAIMFKSSDGEVNEMEADLPVNDNNGYSHCIEVADMSSVVIRNCKLNGGRHVISGVGGGLWEKEECGGKGHAGYPSVLEVDGGVYTGMLRANNVTEHQATLDSHGLIQKMTIKNCTIYGGINLGANEVLVDNVTIYTDEKRILNVGSDVSENAAWGEYIISNSKFIVNKQTTVSLIYGKANVRSLTLRNIEIQNMPATAYLLDFRYFAPHTLVLDNVRLKNIVQRPLVITSRRTGLQIRNSDIDMSLVKWVQ